MAQNWYTTFYDEFTDAFVGLHTQTGNGEITEDSGFLRIKTLGADCRWWSDGQSAPVAYMLFPDVAWWRKGLWRCETKLSAISYTNNNCFPGLVLWQDRDNAVWIGWYPNDSKIYVQQGVADSFSTLYTSAVVVSPNTTAHRYRAYLNLSAHAITVESGAVALPPGAASFWYSVDGVNWVQAYTYSGAVAFTPGRYGPFVRNWSAYPTVTASWEYLKQELDLETDYVLEYQREHSAGSKDSYLARDESTSGEAQRHVHPRAKRGLFTGRDLLDQFGADRGLATAVGAPPYDLRAGSRDWTTNKDDSSSLPPRHSQPRTRAGLYLPAVRGLTARDSRFNADGVGDPAVPRELAAGSTDRVAVKTMSGETRYLHPQTGKGLLLSRGLVSRNSRFNALGAGDPAVEREQSASGLDRAVLAKVDYAIASWINDTDGRAFLGGTNIRQAFLYDASGEPWDAPTPGSGFYGAGRDGKFYVDGNEAGPVLAGTSFGTLAGGWNRRSWMNDTPPSEWYFGVTNPTMTLIADDTVRLSGTAMVNWQAKGLATRHRWALSGDFDIQVNYANFSRSGGTDGGAWIEAIVDNYNYMYCRRQGPAGRYDTDCMLNGGWGNYSFVGTADTAGKLRLARSGSSMSAYYWTGSAWALIRTVTNSVLAKPVHIDVMLGGTGSLTCSCDFSAFTINSGTAINTAGWSREAAGTHRGSRADFPKPALIIPTQSSLDIIDLSTNKLWMRFAAGAGNAFVSTTPPRRVAMKNGILLAALTDTQTNGVMRCDFTMDDIRLHAAAAETWTGSGLRAHNGVYWGQPGVYGRDAGFAGIIASRNSGGGYSGDYNNWQVPSTTSYDCDLWEDIIGGYLYEAMATSSGIGVCKWRRWYMEGASPAAWGSPAYWSSALTTTAIWVYIEPSSQTLYWVTNAGVLYSANAATWMSVVTGGTFAADSSRPLPGSRDLNGFISHYRPVVHDGVVYVSSHEGIWSSAWPAAFALTYGQPASGATHELLPQGSRPTSLFIRRYVSELTRYQLAVALVHGPRRPTPKPPVSVRSWPNLLLIELADNSVAHHRVMPWSQASQIALGAGSEP